MPRQSLNHRVTTDLGTKLRLDPRVVVSSRLLQMPQQEFEEAIEAELNDNPALERVDDDSSRLQDDSALIKKLSNSKEWEPTEDFDSYAARKGNPDESHDWTDFLAAPTSLRDHLAGQLLPMVSKELQGIARHVVDCVNDKGYLDMLVEEIALTGKADLDDVIQIVRLLQTCDPSGVGATNLQECLDIQLSEFDDRIAIVARAIVQRHWDELLQKKMGGIAKKYRLNEGELSEALDRITSLTPYPGEAFVRGVATSQPGSSVTPDVVFKRSEHGVEITIRGCEPSDFIINELYRERFRKMKGRRKSIDPEEKKHVDEFVGRAITFIKGIQYRKRTLRRLAEYMLEAQEGFVTTGSYDFIKPINRVQVARKLGLHESTVSRATLHKYVQLANGEVVSFEVFFKPQLRIRKMIEELLYYENPSAPLTDREIVERLAERGVHVARRTVSKYREGIRQLSSHRRRTA